MPIVTRHWICNETQNVRTFELDLHRFDDTFEVFHLILVDEVSTCQMFTDCLSVIQNWSASKPDRLPVMIWLEMKSGMREEPLEPALMKRLKCLSGGAAAYT